MICEDAGVAMELSEHFKYRVEGYQFMPSYKARRWDGYLRIYNAHTKLIYVGLLPLIEKFAKDRDYSIEYETDFSDSEFSLHEAEQLFESLNTEFDKNDFQTALQITTATKAIRKNRSIIISPTGSGKSFIIYLLTKHYNKKTLIIVPTIGLVHQMHSDFVSYGYDGELMHKIYSGKEKYTEHPVVVGTWQSIAKLPKTWLSEFDVVIGDEVHLFSAKSLITIMENMNDTKYRFGLTGTLDKSETNKLVLMGLFGSIIQETTTAELIEKKVLAPLKIKCIILKYPEEIRKSVVRAEYEDEINYIISHENRNNFLKNLALSLKGNTLMLFTRIESHGDILDKKIREAISDDRKYFYVHGGVSGEDRDALRPIVEKSGTTMIFEFGNLKVEVDKNLLIPLSNGSLKLAKSITIEDDIDDNWVKVNIL